MAGLSPPAQTPSRATARPFVSMRPEMATLSLDEADAEPAPKSRTCLVLLLLVAAAATLSFLGTYALTNVLVQAEVLAKWPENADPRPRWLALGFTALLGLFLVVGFAARQLSQSQLRQIDAMAD